MPRAETDWRRQFEKRIQSLIRIELGVRDQTAGVVERGLQIHLHLAARGALHPGTEQHIRLPGLIGELGFVLFVSGGRGFVQQQLPFGKSAGARKR